MCRAGQCHAAARRLGLGQALEDPGHDASETPITAWPLTISG